VGAEGGGGRGGIKPVRIGDHCATNLHFNALLRVYITVFNDAENYVQARH